MDALPEKHLAKVRALSEQMKRFYKDGVRVKIYHGSTNSIRAQTFDPARMLDTSMLNEVLYVDREGRFALVEPSVPMDALVRETLKYGLVPPVVPEFPGITIGGAIQGGAGESSTFKYGGVHECCDEYEMILGNGGVVRTSPQSDGDLFLGTAGSYGSLGVITLVKIRLLPATKYVRLRYTRFENVGEMVEATKRTARTDVDFIDGIIFSDSCSVIMSGVRTDEPATRTSRFSRPWDEWFYLHVKKIAKKYDTYEETIPLTDYLFRYDRGGFWMASYGFKRWSLPFNRVSRFFVDPFMRTRALYNILHATNLSQQFIIQDICLPEETAEQFLNFIRDKFAIYPLWILPIKFDSLAPFLSAPNSSRAIDVGVWGDIPATKQHFETFLRLNREIETTTNALGGRKMLYAQAFYPKEEFWKIYDFPEYEALRKKYNAERTFLDIYEKVYVGDRYQLQIGKGLAHVISNKLKTVFGFAKESGRLARQQ